jgi:hypothetical protein
VAHGFLNGTDTLLNTDGTPFLTVQGIIDAANSSMGSYPVTKAGAAARPAQERLKNAADGLNQNNGLYVVPANLAGATARCGAPTFA